MKKNEKVLSRSE